MPTITDFTHVLVNYTDDQAGAHVISQRKAVQTAVGNVVSASAGLGRPARWKLRAVHLQYTDSTGHIFRKKCVIGDVTNPLWGASPGSVANLDGVTWLVRGRVGEKRA